MIIWRGERVGGMSQTPAVQQIKTVEFDDINTKNG
jgi:hypothetical protein